MSTDHHCAKTTDCGKEDIEYDNKKYAIVCKGFEGEPCVTDKDCDTLGGLACGVSYDDKKKTWAEWP